MEKRKGLTVNDPADNAFDARKIFAGASCWVVTDGKAGDEAPCLGLARAMGLAPQRRVVRPRKVFAALAPRGPIDPAEAPSRPGSPIAPPFPDVLIASGRRAVPYLRHMRRASGGRTFTIFLKDPRMDVGVADVVWVAEHDSPRGSNVVVTLAAPHLVSAEALAEARAHPDPQIARLPEPRMALLAGGDSRHHRFLERDHAALVGVIEAMRKAGASVMITPSRRTPPALVAALRAACTAAPENSFLWDGGGANPYIQMLAHAQAIVVTADSTNMVGEAIATEAPVMVYEPSGGHPRLSRFIEALVAAGRVRRWSGCLESWPCAPVDATDEIARDIAERYAKWRAQV